MRTNIWDIITFFYDFVNIRSRFIAILYFNRKKAGHFCPAFLHCSIVAAVYTRAAERILAVVIVSIVADATAASAAATEAATALAYAATAPARTARALVAAATATGTIFAATPAAVLGR